MRTLCLVLAIALVVLAPRIAWAQADDARRNVEIAITGDADEARLLEETLREIFARRALVVVRAAAGVARDSVLARVDVDLSAGRFAVADGRNGQVVLEKTKPRETGDASIVREEIAL